MGAADDGPDNQRGNVTDQVLNRMAVDRRVGDRGCVGVMDLVDGRIQALVNVHPPVGVEEHDLLNDQPHSAVPQQLPQTGQRAQIVRTLRQEGMEENGGQERAQEEVEHDQRHVLPQHSEVQAPLLLDLPCARAQELRDHEESPNAPEASADRHVDKGHGSRQPPHRREGNLERGHERRQQESHGHLLYERNHGHGDREVPHQGAHCSATVGLHARK
mmetsp:Transcript_82807/g.213344  ORF Transcript_82807/g.213344 Transcript_82807/m.213344 type:complete len:217 (-) Transcript_82807:72-722(-)